MGYIDAKLRDGEQVVFRTKRHPAVLIFPVIAIAVAVTFFGASGLGLLLAVLAACWLAVGLAAHGASEFGVTNQRVLMKTGGNAFATHLNKFNRVMSLGNNLAQRFSAEFGDIQCQAITGCDFSALSAVNRYIETDGLARCSQIADKVADMVLSLLPAEQVS